MRTNFLIIIAFAVMLSAMISSDAIVFADEADSKDLEPSDEIRECVWEKNQLDEHPHSRYAMCDLQQCEEPPSTVKERTRVQIAEQKVILENDYIVKQFLRKHPEVTLEGSALDIVNTLTPITWKITDPHDLESVKATSAAKLYVNFDRCSHITGYFYDVTHREDDGIRATYRYGDADPNLIATFEEKKYQLAETIMERHLPPRIQINEFDIPPDKIRCNDGLVPVEKHDGSPACVKERSIPKLIERGWMQENNPEITKVSQKIEHVLDTKSSDQNIDLQTVIPNITIHGLRNTYDIFEPIEFEIVLESYGIDHGGFEVDVTPAANNDDTNKERWYEAGDVALPDTEPESFARTYEFPRRESNPIVFTKPGWYNIDFFRSETEKAEWKFYVQYNDELDFTNNVQEFQEKLDPGMKYEDLVWTFGEPDNDIGSGMHIYVYDMDNGSKILIGYADYIWYAKHVDYRYNLITDLLGE